MTYTTDSMTAFFYGVVIVGSIFAVLYALQQNDKKVSKVAREASFKKSVAERERKEAFVAANPGATKIKCILDKIKDEEGEVARVNLLTAKRLMNAADTQKWDSVVLEEISNLWDTLNAKKQKERLFITATETLYALDRRAINRARRSMKDASGLCDYVANRLLTDKEIKQRDSLFITIEEAFIDFTDASGINRADASDEKLFSYASRNKMYDGDSLNTHFIKEARTSAIDSLELYCDNFKEGVNQLVAEREDRQKLQETADKAASAALGWGIILWIILVVFFVMLISALIPLMALLLIPGGLVVICCMCAV